jgi:hypothetical protein
MSYGGTLAASTVTYILGLQSWPVMVPFSWFLSPYSWFSSVFYFCNLAFPWCHRAFFRVKRDIKALWKLTAVWIVLHFAYMGAAATYFALDNGADANPAIKNYFTLSAYLLPIGWLPCFVFGVAMFFMFQHYSEGRTKRNKQMWGCVTDSISLVCLACWLFYGLATVSVPHHVQTPIDERQWFAYVSRLLVPGTAMWAWGIAIGNGLTAKLFSAKFVVDYLAPASYSMFLFHQPLSEWYFLATRHTWWAYPKTFFWFSPLPVPIHFWEFPIVMLIIILACMALERYVNDPLIGLCSRIGRQIVNVFVCKKSNKSYSQARPGVGARAAMSDGITAELLLVQQVVTGMTQYEVDADTVLVEAGINSMMSSILLNKLNRKLPKDALKLSQTDFRGIDTVGGLAQVIRDKAGGGGKSSSSYKKLALDNTRETADMGARAEAEEDDEQVDLSSNALLPCHPR